MKRAKRAKTVDLKVSVYTVNEPTSYGEQIILFVMRGSEVAPGCEFQGEAVVPVAAYEASVLKSGGMLAYTREELHELI